MVPRLLQFRVSHYNEKVRWALDWKRVPHVRDSLIAGWHIPRVRLLTGQNKVPVLILDGKAMAGSANILAELERLYPDPPLLPADPAGRARALALEQHFDDEVAPDLRRLFWSTYFPHKDLAARLATDGSSAAARVAWGAFIRVAEPVLRANMGASAAGIARAHERLSGHFDRLERELDGRPYLVGDRFGHADLAVAAVMSALLRPPEFPYPLPDPWPEELVALRDSVSHRAGFRWVIDVYARHRGTSSEVRG